MQPEPHSLSDFVSAESLTKNLGVSRKVLLGWIDRGLPFIRVGTRLYFHEAAFAMWLKSQERTRVVE